MSMTETRSCPRCQIDLPLDAPQGLCPACLLGQALEGPRENPPDPGRSPFPAFVPPSPTELARHFPQLEILDIIGQGGMGAVYKARQPKLDRLVAIKVLPPEVARDATFAERFTREAKSLARLNHPNIVTIYDFGESDGLYFFTMEYVDGKTVRQLLDAGALPPAQALNVVPQVCDALQYAHDEGIVHRDIKPENILLDRRGRVKIADFGLAKIVGLSPAYLTLTGTHEVMGTLYYMAPEQMKRSQTIDNRADLYSLGVVFYEMLTGELPLGRFAPPSHKARVDARLDPIVLRALVREREQRYQDAAEFKKDVEGVLSGVAAAPSVGLTREVPPAARGPWPCVRFSIPGITWFGSEAQGEIYRDDQTLIIEYRRVLEPFKSRQEEVRIPFGEIISLSCQTEAWGDLAGLAKRMRHLTTTEIVIKAVRGSAAEQLPAGRSGRGRLLVRRQDRQAARDLVESIVRPLVPEIASDVLRPMERPQLAKDVEQVRFQLMWPALGLMVAAVMVCVVNVVHYAEVIPESRHLGITLAAIAGAFCMMAGAVQMVRLRSYPLVIAAGIVALVPVWEAWWCAVPFGVWALALVSQPSIRSTIQSTPQEPVVALPSVPPVWKPVAGAMRSFALSCAGYFVSGLTRLRRRDENGSPGGLPAAADKPLAETTNYVPDRNAVNDAAGKS
jgi:serine/threonine protein kinase